MNQQPDKFFRDNLQGYQKSMSPDAWRNLSLQLERKRTFSLWIKVAASLLLLTTAGTFFVIPDDATRAEMATNSVSRTDNTTRSPEKVLTPSYSPADDRRADETKTTTEPGKAPVQSRALPSRRKSPIAPQEPSRQPDELPETDPAHAVHQPLAAMQDKPSGVLASPEENEIPSEHVEVEKSDRKSITLVYSAAEVNAKFLEKKSVAQATPGKDKPSTLKKLLDKAHDLKNNQDAMGGLRQMKNEILAFNFSGDKPRKN